MGCPMCSNMVEVQSVSCPVNRRLMGIGLVFVSSMLIAVTPNAAKIAYLEGANTLAVVTARSVIGVLALAGYMILRGGWPGSGFEVFRSSVRAGIAQALTSIGFIGAVAYIDVSLAALIFYLHTFLIAIVGHFRGHTKLGPRLFLCIAAAIGGVALVLGVTADTIDLVGLGLAFLGMGAVTVMVLALGDMSQRIGPIPANLYMTLWAALIFIVIVLVAPVTDAVDPAIWPKTALGWIGVLGNGLSLTLGFVLFFTGAGMIGMTRAIVLSIAEPVFAILLAIVLIGEWLAPVQWLGVAVIVVSLYVFEATMVKRHAQ